MDGFKTGVPGSWIAKLNGVYFLRHVKTGAFYIGSTKDLFGRYQDHTELLRKGNHYSQRLQSLYNEDPRLQYDTFIVETRLDAFELEQQLINEHAGSPFMLNIAVDVRSGTKGRALPLEHKQRIAATLRGRPHSAERREKIAAINRLRSRAVVIDGVTYAGAAEAGRALGHSIDRVRKRIMSNNPAFAMWQYANGEDQ